jgi:uncharacterized protein (TIGR03663 family)
MAQQVYDDPPVSILDRTIDLTRISLVTIGAIVAIAVGFALRFAQLNVVALSTSEARHAYEAYSFFRGDTSGPNQALSDTNPAFLVLQAITFFLFGATDVVARTLPALLGGGMVLLAWLLWPFVGKARALGMAALVALSPTLLFASRTADVEIAVAFFALLLVVSFLRIGLAGSSPDARRAWALAMGFSVAAIFASGPTSISVLICVVVGLAVSVLANPGVDSAPNRSLATIKGSADLPLFLLIGFLATLLVFFTRLFSDLTALAGLSETIADWGRLMTSSATTTPTQFFLLAILLYEPLAIAFGIVVANRKDTDGPGQLSWAAFAGWFVAAMLLFSFESGRQPSHAIHVALPLVLLGGCGLGDLFSALDLRKAVRSRAGTLFSAMVGLVVAVIAFFVLLNRADSDTVPSDDRSGLQAVVIIVLAVVPLAYAVVHLVTADRKEGRGGQAGLIALGVLALFLGGYTLRSTVELSYFNAASGSELLAQQTSTGSVSQLVDRLRNLSRDVTVTERTVKDPTGGHGLSVAIDRRVQWPYRWYFRDFPEAQVVAAGQASGSSAQVVIAPDETGMAEGGYTPRSYPTINRVPAAYTAPSIGDILADIFVPSHWPRGLQFVIDRELDTAAPPQTIAVGLNAELANRLFPNSGPYNLSDRPGAGSGRGQFSGPRGLSVAGDDSAIYVVDMGNARVERFDGLGQFVGIWGGTDSNVVFSKTDSGLGPTGIAVSADGQLIYVADTWAHRIVVLDNSGRMVREFGTYADTADSPDPSVSPGSFFGPRSIAVTDDEIYVVDTGNERVQVLALDGTFKRAFGGYGTEPGQLIEPVGIAIGPDGRVYVADSGNGRISIYSKDGTSVGEWQVDAWAGQLYFEPYLAVDVEGNVYASSSGTASVEVYDPNGQWITSISRIGSEDLKQPVGLAIAPDGSVWISDIGANAVFRYTPNFEPPPDDEIIEELPGASPEASPAASPQASPVASSR